MSGNGNNFISFNLISKFHYKQKINKKDYKTREKGIQLL